jgi:hypothetical protein
VLDKHNTVPKALQGLAKGRRKIKPERAHIEPVSERPRSGRHPRNEKRQGVQNGLVRDHDSIGVASLLNKPEDLRSSDVVFPILVPFDSIALSACVEYLCIRV